MSTEAAQRVAARFLTAGVHPLTGLRRRADKARYELEKQGPKLKELAQRGEDDPENRYWVRYKEIVEKAIGDVHLGYAAGQRSVEATVYHELKALDRNRSKDHKRRRKLDMAWSRIKFVFRDLEKEESDHHRTFQSEGPTPAVVDAYVNLATRIVKVFDRYLAL
jgi:hypothetical protein